MPGGPPVGDIDDYEGAAEAIELYLEAMRTRAIDLADLRSVTALQAWLSSDSRSERHQFRYGLVAALATAPDVKVVGEAVDGRELLTVVQREQPDVVLTDLTMPGLNDCWPTSPALRVVVLTMHEDDEAVFQAMRTGAHGFLVKGADVQETSCEPSWP